VLFVGLEPLSSQAKAASFQHEEITHHLAKQELDQN
jgi:hypothetical protein